jgi:hypothetical protein
MSLVNSVFAARLLFGFLSYYYLLPFSLSTASESTLCRKRHPSAHAQLYHHMVVLSTNRVHCPWPRYKTCCPIFEKKYGAVYPLPRTSIASYCVAEINHIASYCVAEINQLEHTHHQCWTLNLYLKDSGPLKCKQLYSHSFMSSTTLLPQRRRGYPLY